MGIERGQRAHSRELNAALSLCAVKMNARCDGIGITCVSLCVTSEGGRDVELLACRVLFASLSEAWPACGFDMLTVDCQAGCKRRCCENVSGRTCSRRLDARKQRRDVDQGTRVPVVLRAWGRKIFVRLTIDGRIGAFHSFMNGALMNQQVLC